MIPPFSHLDAGTDESVWAVLLAEVRLRPVPSTIRELVVVAAHPDDETLGAAGLMARVSADGGAVTVVVATDGEASHPHSPTHSPRRLATARREEVVRAIDLVAPGARLMFLGLPDGGLREHADALKAAVEGVLSGFDGLSDAAASDAGILVVAPWTGDGHRDHRIAGEVVESVCAARGLPSLGYPVWLWHWGSVGDLPAASAFEARLSSVEQERKRAAIQAHTTQIHPLSSATGDEAVVHEGMRAHFERDTEVFLEQTPAAADAAASLDAGWFDSFYARNGDDPWGFESRWYEERKRGILLASLPTRHLGATLEIGCATGMITVALAARADSVIAVDAADRAVQRCRQRVAHLTHVHVERATVPSDWPGGTFDTIVLSEVGYYLSVAALAELIDRMEVSLAPGGRIAAVHWRHPVAEYPQRGDGVHVALRAHSGWEATVRHLEKDFVLEVFEHRPAPSVAQRERLA